MSQELRTQRHAAVAPRTVGQSTRLAAQTVVRPCHGDASCDQPCRFTEDTIAQIMHVYPDAFQLEQVCACPNSTCLAEKWQVAVTGSLVAHGAIQMQIKPPVVVGAIKCFLKQSMSHFAVSESLMDQQTYLRHREKVFRHALVAIVKARPSSHQDRYHF